MLKQWRLVSLYAVFRNLVTLVITSGEATWGYRELQMSHKLEHGPRYYKEHDHPGYNMQIVCHIEEEEDADRGDLTNMGDFKPTSGNATKQLRM